MRITLSNLVGALLCALPLPAIAMPITYDTDLLVGEEGSVRGTITTDGTIGAILDSSGIIGWDLALRTDKCLWGAQGEGRCAYCFRAGVVVLPRSPVSD